MGLPIARRAWHPVRLKDVRPTQIARRNGAGSGARSTFGSLLVILALLAGQRASADSLYWDGNGTCAGAGNTSTLLNKIWGTDSIWNSDAAGVTDTFRSSTTAFDDLFFVAAPSASRGNVTFNPTVSGEQSAASITFQQSGNASLSGGTSITLHSANGLNFSNGTGANSISTALILGASTAFTNSDNSLQTISGGVTGAFDLTILGDNTGSFTFATGSVNNQGIITNLGAGTNTTTISAVVGAKVTGVTQNATNSLLVLSGANTTYTGTTTLSLGTLRGTNTATTNVLNAFGSGALQLDGGILQLRANGAGNSQTIVVGNAVTIGSNATTIDVNNNGANSGSAITLGNLALGSGPLTVTGGNTYRLAFTGANNTLTANATFNPTTANVSVTGVIADGGSSYGFTKIGGGTLTLSGANSFSGAVVVKEGILALGANAPSGADGVLGNATSAILLGDTGGALSASLVETGTFTIARDIIVQSGNGGTMSVGSTAQGNSFSIYSGAITLGSAGGSGHGLTLTGNSFHTTTFSGVIQDPTELVGPGGALTVAGGTSSSNIVLSNTNTFTGGIVLNTGTLKIAALQALGLGTLTINGGAISQSASGAVVGLTGQTWQGNFSFSATSGPINLGTSPVSVVGARTIGVDNGSVVVGGVISGTGGSLRFNSSNFSASVTLNGANTFDGGITIAQVGTSSVTLVAGSASALGTGQVRLSNAANSRLSLAANLTVDSLTSGISAITTISGGTGGTSGTYALVFTGGGGSGAAGTATISGGAITAVNITELGTNYTSAPTITLAAGGGTGTVTSSFGSSSGNLNPGTARVLTIAGTNASPSTYSGVISGTGGSLIKNGSGTQSLTGANTYTGGTTINDGNLRLGNTTGSATGSGQVLVSGGISATVSGTGTATGLTTVTGGSRLAPGANSAGNFGQGGLLSLGTTGGLTLSDAHLDFDLDITAAAATNDSLSTSTLSLGSTIAFTFNGLGGSLETGSAYTLINAGAVTGFDPNHISSTFLGNLSGLYSAAYSLDVNNDLLVTFTAIPEPSAASALLGGFCLLAGLQRLRRRRVNVA